MNPPFDPARVFDAVPDACVVLDADLVMAAANRAYLEMSGKSLSELLGRRVPEVFPVNPEDAAANTRLDTAYRRVLRTGRPHRMGVVRYDVTTEVPGGFDVRYWSVTIVPVVDDTGRVTHVVHRGRNVTDLHTDLLRIQEIYRRELGEDAAHDDASATLMEVEADTVATGELAATLVAEVEQMREAMATRSAIEQAKGALMATHGCDADTAFGLLRTQSQDTNTKLHQVAASLVAALVARARPSADAGAGPAPATEPDHR